MATPEHWADVEQWGGTLTACFMELRARIEALEGKYETMRLDRLAWWQRVGRDHAALGRDQQSCSGLRRGTDPWIGDASWGCSLVVPTVMRLATLDWGEDIDNHSRWIDDQLKRIEALEAAANDRQQNEDNERAMPSAPPADGLVQRVADAIATAETGWSNEARAAIREVARWLKSEPEGYLASGLHWSQRLEHEADHD